METWKDARIREIQRRAEREVARLAGEFARAPAGQREELLAAIEEERWLAQACRELCEPW